MTLPFDDDHDGYLLDARYVKRGARAETIQQDHRTCAEKRRTHATIARKSHRLGDFLPVTVMAQKTTGHKFKTT